ncbi:MAG: GTP cyclohydrolase I, partial [Planctomycetes bacterium]|nr:GTP cyclohydrolase I [Planctomycetota bacterium]
MMMRGVEKTHSTTASRVLRGVLRTDASLRRECLEMMARS